jgi:type VI secretion system protein
MTMTLTLTITKHPEMPAGEPMSRALDRCGVVIGRGKDSDWMLPDPDRHLSKQHCRIEFRGDRYYVVDISKNGVFVNESIEPLRQGNMAELNDGDRLTLGDYELEVRIESEARRPAAREQQQIPDEFDPFGQEPFDEPERRPLERSSSESSFRGEMLIPNTDPSIDPIAELAGPENRSLSGGQQLIPDDIDLITGLPRTPVHEGAPQKDHAPAEQQYFRPPSPSRVAIPEDWGDDAVGTADPPAVEAPPPRAAPVRERTPVTAAPRTATPAPRTAVPAPRPRAPAGAGADLLRAFLEGAGIEDTALADDDPDGTLRMVGQMFRDMVAGLHEILRSRTAFKSEFRIERTMIQQTQNNPLKISPTADEALAVLLRQSKSGYLPPVEAVRQGVDDIKAHQLAVIAGLQVALVALLQEFDPENLKQRLEQQRSVLANLMPGAKNAKAWEIYEAFYKEVATEAEQGFDGIFGREFRRAYEEQLKKL